MPAPPIGWTTHATVSRVIDADTVEVDINRRLVIRLNACWAMEDDTPKGREATVVLRQLLSKGDEVTVRIDASDRGLIGDIITFSRFVGDIWKGDDGVSVTEVLVSGGYAFPTKRQQLAAQKAAQ